MLCFAAPLFGQVAVPFVGCASFGQTGESPAPKGAAKSVRITSEDAHRLAYYTDGGNGVLAPRGWFCEGVSGSSGSALYVSPKPVDRYLNGPVIARRYISAGASGAWEIAEIKARDFPEYASAGRTVLEGLDGPIPTGPYAGDTLTRKSKTTVEFTTEAQSEGLGTHNSWIAKNNLPITGAAIFTGLSTNFGGPDVVLVSVRLPPELQHLIPAIVGEVERETPPPGPPK